MKPRFNICCLTLCLILSSCFLKKQDSKIETKKLTEESKENLNQKSNQSNKEAGYKSVGWTNYCGDKATDDCDDFVVKIENTGTNYDWVVIQSMKHGYIEKAFQGVLENNEIGSTLLEQSIGYGPDAKIELYNNRDGIILTLNAQQNFCSSMAGNITFTTSSNSETVTLECTSYEGAYWDNHSGCVSCFINTPGYSPDTMETKFEGESTECSWQNNTYPNICPPYVIYYNRDQRELLELTVSGNLIYNSLGELFNTRNDPLDPNRPAIFVMGFDGRIYASNNYKNGLLHHSSIFAGDINAASGEMIVHSGKIMQMNNCSGHYLPSETITKQAILSLKAQGYTDPITFTPC